MSAGLVFGKLIEAVLSHGHIVIGDLQLPQKDWNVSRRSQKMK